MRSRPVPAFFLLALLLSWAGWIPYAASQAGRITVKVAAELIWLAEYGPSLAAILVAAWLEGRTGVGNLLRPVLRWRVAPRWYAIVLLLTPALVALVVLLAAILGREIPEAAAWGAWQSRFVERTAAFSPSAGLISGLVEFMRGGVVQTALVFALLAITNGGVSEEIGWRGFALPRLQGRWNALAASVLVGLLWAVWHTGTGFWQMMLTAEAPAAWRFAATYLVQYALLVVPLAVIYTWVVNSTGSLLLAILLHASWNMTVVVATAAWPAFPMAWMIALLWLVALVVIGRFGAARLSSCVGYVESDPNYQTPRPKS